MGNNSEPVFPNTAEIFFVLEPLQPFGMEAENGRTATKGIAARLLFNANTGHWTIKSETPLNPLDVTIEDESGWLFELKGNLVRFSFRASSLSELFTMVQGIYFQLPILLNAGLSDPPVVTRAYGTLGEAPFRWELKEWKCHIRTTTQEKQEEGIEKAWQRMEMVGEIANRRLAAALHYFYVACRLSRVGSSPWEFMGETLLNFSKMLEVLFPPQGDGTSIDAARSGLRRLSFTDEEIERDYIPAIALRNGMDSGHVHLSLLNRQQLTVLHNYTEDAEIKFGLLTERLIEKVESGDFELRSSEDFRPSRAELQIIKRLDHHQMASAGWGASVSSSEACQPCLIQKHWQTWTCFAILWQPWVSRQDVYQRGLY